MDKDDLEDLDEFDGVDEGGQVCVHEYYICLFLRLFLSLSALH